jgi:hypothetical protein
LNYIETIKAALQIDWSNVDTAKLSKDAEFITLMQKYENALSGAGEYANSAAGYRQARMAECIEAIKELMYTHQIYTSVIESQETKRLKFSQCVVAGQDPVAYRNRLGINIDLHSRPGSSTIESNTVFELSQSGSTALDDIMESDVIILGENTCDLLSESNVTYLVNNMADKIVIMSEVGQESPAGAMFTPFKKKVSEADIAYSKVNAANFNLYMHSESEQHVLLYDNNMPILAFMFVNGGMIMQWCIQPYVSYEYDTNTIDRIIYEIISAYLLNGTSLQQTIINLNSHIVQYETSSQNSFPATKIYNSGSISITLSRNGAAKVVSGSYTAGNQKSHTETREIIGAAQQDDSLFEDHIQCVDGDLAGSLPRTEVEWTPQLIGDRTTTQTRTVEATVFPATQEAIDSRIAMQPATYGIPYYDAGSGQSVAMELELSETHETANLPDGSCKITFHYSGTTELPPAPSGLFNGVATYDGILSSGGSDSRIWQQEYVGDISYDSTNSAVVTYKEKKAANSFLDRLYYNQDGYEGWLQKDGEAVNLYESETYQDQQVSGWIENRDDIAPEMTVKSADGTSSTYNLMHVEETLLSGEYEPGYMEEFSTNMYKFFQTKYEAEQAAANGLPTTIFEEGGIEYVMKYEAVGGPTQSDTLFSYQVYENYVSKYCNSYQEAASSTYTLYGTSESGAPATRTLTPGNIYSYCGSDGTRKYAAVFNVAAANWQTSWRVEFSRTKLRAESDTRVYGYRGHYSYVADKLFEWEQAYKGTVKKTAFSNTYYRGLTIAQDKAIDSYDVESQRVILETAKRHAIRINDISAFSHTYHENGMLQSINVMDKLPAATQIKSVAFYCDEFYPELASKIGDVVRYSLVVNGRSYEVVPINSKRNGIKIIRNTNFADNSGYVTYINEKVNTLVLNIRFTLADQKFSPHINNIKLLIK